MTAAYIADECFSGRVLRALRDAGFDVIRSVEINPSASDVEVLELAFSAGRILLTEDTDFGDLVVRSGLRTRGVVRLELNALSRQARAQRAVQALTQLGEGAWGAIVSIEPSRTRVRRLGDPATG
jgi:predicted nuclease of predicted toxin-antitoxin system